MTPALDLLKKVRAEHRVHSYEHDPKAASYGLPPAEALTGALTSVQATPSLVVASGMVGSALGWHEVPYVDASVPLQDLGRHVFRVPDAPGDATVVLVPGYCIRNSAGVPDVMRGEETQIAGALALRPAFDGVLCLPGTHSKWVHLSAGEVVSFQTFLFTLMVLLRRCQKMAASLVIILWFQKKVLRCTSMPLTFLFGACSRK